MTDIDYDLEGIRNYYLDNSLRQTAKYYNCSTTKIYKILNENNIFKPKLPEYLSKEQLEIVNGSLLGDGSIGKLRFANCEFVESHSDKQKNYCKWKYDILKPYSNGFCSTKGKGFNKNTDKLSWYMRTHLHPVFTELEKKWYSRDNNGNYVLNKHNCRVKIIPKDLKLTPLTMAIWFFDDGGMSVSERRVCLYTYSFTKEECLFLSKLIKTTFNIKYCHIGINRKSKNDQFKIIISRSSFVEFINIVSPFLPCEELKYKIDLSNYTHPKNKIKQDVIDQIILLNKAGKTQKSIANILGISRNTVNKYSFLEKTKNDSSTS